MKSSELKIKHIINDLLPSGIILFGMTISVLLWFLTLSHFDWWIDQSVTKLFIITLSIVFFMSTLITLAIDKIRF